MYISTTYRILLNGQIIYSILFTYYLSKYYEEVAMEQIYSVGGNFNKGFVGQISYTICLDRPYEEMQIDFSFDKQYHAEMPGMKTEIQLITMMNDEFIGGIHNQDNPKQLYFSSEKASKGCIPQDSIHGVVRIIIVVFSVILDDTNYTLSLSTH